MIAVEEADRIILDTVREMPAQEVPLEEARGRVLREDLRADRNFPPFDRVVMDGFAIAFASWESGTRHFLIEGIQKAGMESLALTRENGCIEVMTGAVLPEGCDCVIPIEDIAVTEDKINLQDSLILSRHMNIHEKGKDRVLGELLVTQGCRLLSPQIAVAAATGKIQILVSQTPKVLVIGTGDELVAIDQLPKPHQIRQSNSHALQALFTLNGFPCVDRRHIKDDKQELRESLRKALKEYDVLVLSGGVSMGKYDFVPEVLTDLGVKVLFHKVKQRPGKPFWFGQSESGKPVFALPGNPVSTQIGAARYVVPYLKRMVGMEPLAEWAMLQEAFEVNTPFTYFAPVRLSFQKNNLVASVISPSCSGDFASLAGSDGFVELPPGTFTVAQGAAVPVYRW